jgi:hypothetical protein
LDLPEPANQFKNNSGGLEILLLRSRNRLSSAHFEILSVVPPVFFHQPRTFIKNQFKVSQLLKESFAMPTVMMQGSLTFPQCGRYSNFFKKVHKYFIKKLELTHDSAKCVC